MELLDLLFLIYNIKLIIHVSVEPLSLVYEAILLLLILLLIPPIINSGLLFLLSLVVDGKDCDIIVCPNELETILFIIADTLLDFWGVTDTSSIFCCDDTTGIVSEARPGFILLFHANFWIDSN